MSDDAFQASASKVKTLKKAPSNQELLQLYALFKQGSAGDASGKRPSAFKLKDRAKFDAWTAVKGIGQDDAKSKYVALVEDLVSRLG